MENLTLKQKIKKATDKIEQLQKELKIYKAQYEKKLVTKNSKDIELEVTENPTMQQIYEFFKNYELPEAQCKYYTYIIAADYLGISHKVICLYWKEKIFEIADIIDKTKKMIERINLKNPNHLEVIVIKQIKSFIKFKKTENQLIEQI